MRHPLLRFLAAGALLALAHWGVAQRNAGRAEAVRARGSAPVVIGSARLARLFERQKRWNGAPLSDEERRAIADLEVEEALLLRAAVDLGLDRADPRIGWRLLEKMRYLGEADESDPAATVRRAAALGLDEDDAVVRRLLTEKMRSAARFAGDREPSEEEIAAFFAQNRERWRRSGRTDFWHVFVPADRARPAGAAETARVLLAALRVRGDGPEEGSRRGAPFPSGRQMRGADARALARGFGPGFAEAISTLPVGAWQGPIASAYGEHLVWVTAREGSGYALLDDVRNQVVRAWKTDQRDLRAREFVARLRRSYDVRVEWPAHGATSTSGGQPDA